MTDLRTLTTRPAPHLERGDDWRDQAACKGKLELFHPPGISWAQHKEQRDAALAICRHTCPVRQACLDDALAREFDPFAILGGTTPGQRKHLKAATPAITVCGICRREFRSPAGLAAHQGIHERPTCSQGHDRTVVGSYSDGSCKQCRRESSARARKAAAA